MIFYSVGLVYRKDKKLHKIERDKVNKENK